MKRPKSSVGKSRAMVTKTRKLNIWSLAKRTNDHNTDAEARRDVADAADRRLQLRARQRGNLGRQ